MKPKRNRFVVMVGRTPVNVLQLGAVLFVVMLAAVFVLSRLGNKPVGPPIDSRFNDTSEFVTKYDYPFTSLAQQQSLEKDAYVIYDGSEIYNVEPDNTGVWPSGYSQPLTMSVYFPTGTLTPEDPESMRWTDPRSKTSYSCFRGIPVPRNDPSALRRTLSYFSADSTGGSTSVTSPGFPGWRQVAPIHLCFAEGTEPDTSVQLLDVTGIYRYDSGRTPINGQPASRINYPMVEIGSFDSVGYDQIAAAARTILRSGVTIQRGKLRITLDRVELAPNSTRIHFTVINGSNDSIDWAWRQPRTFLLLDGAGGTSVFPEEAGTDDELPTTFGPARSEGSIFFPRIQQPQSSMVLKIVDPVDPEALIEVNLPLSQLRDVPARKRL
jgi:hypothetical protein